VLFSSPVFLFLFLPLVLAGYFLVPRKLRNTWLFLASLLFYAWGEPVFVLVMLASIAANWSFGLAVARAERGRRAKAVIALAIVFDIGLLAFFKYAHFLWDNLGAFAGYAGLSGEWPEIGPVRLPIGISFFTFQALSYVIDVYRREGPAQRNPVNFGLYIALFPQLIAGPIVRYRDVAAQILGRAVTRPGFAQGVRRFVIGLGKKMLIANVMAEVADPIFALDPAKLTAPVAWLGTLAYTLQIYFDFSGYSDMAIGLGLMFGFRFLENFDYPYVATTVTEFWRRWHISLSTWFRDYLYIPMGGNRRGRGRTYLNLLVVFFLCGLWHGAAWNFVVWGLFHGTFLVLERIFLRARETPRRDLVGHAYTLLVAMVGWVFFRAETLPRAMQHLGAMFGLGLGDGVEVRPALYLNSLVWLVLAAGAIGSVPWLPALSSWRERLVARRLARGQGAGLFDLGLELSSIAGLVAVFVASAMMLSAGTYNPFIYFRF
jgi:alginate O-acetyltransferase complex protein AlgI